MMKKRTIRVLRNTSVISILFIFSLLAGCNQDDEDCAEQWFLVENSLVSNANTRAFCDKVSALQTLEYIVTPPIVIGDEKFTVEWEVSEGYEIVEVDPTTQLFAQVRMGNIPGEICVTVTSSVCGRSNTICRSIVTVQRENVFFSTTDFPNASPSGQVAMTLNDQAYIGLGFNGSSEDYSWFRFDSRAETWIRLGDFPDNTVNPTGTAMVVGGKGYVYFEKGGSNNNPRSSFWEYDPALDRWTRKADFEDPTVSHRKPIMLGFPDKGYLVAGDGGLTDTYKYLPSTDTWTQIENFPGIGRYDATSYTYNGKGYVGGGLTSGNCGDQSTMGRADGFILDTGTDTWLEWTNPAPVKGIVIQYSSSEYIVFDDSGLRKYDPATETFGMAYGNDAPCNIVAMPNECGSSYVRDGVNIISIGSRPHTSQPYNARVVVWTPDVDWF